MQTRTATKRGGGSSKNGRNSIGKRLGVKKYGGKFCLTVLTTSTQTLISLMKYRTSSSSWQYFS